MAVVAQSEEDKARAARYVEIVQKPALTNLSTARDLFQSMGGQILKSLPAKMRDPKYADTVVQVGINFLQQNPKLLECTPKSMAAAIIRAASLGFTFDPLIGHAYPVPFRNKKLNNGKGGMEVNLIVGYKGLVHLALKSGYVEYVIGRNVFDCDEIDFSEGTGENSYIRHKRNINPPDDAKLIASYAIALLKNGSQIYWLSPLAEIEAARKRSAAKSFGPWVSDFDQMARKTPMRRLCNDMPKTDDLQKAISWDEIHEAGLSQAEKDSESMVMPGGSWTAEDAQDPMQGPLDALVEREESSQAAEPEPPEPNSTLDPAAKGEESTSGAAPPLEEPFFGPGDPQTMPPSAADVERIDAQAAREADTKPIDESSTLAKAGVDKPKAKRPRPQKKPKPPLPTDPEELRELVAQMADNANLTEEAWTGVCEGVGSLDADLSKMSLEQLQAMISALEAIPL